MKSITETEVEEFAIELLQNSGYEYLNGPEIAPDGSCPERGSYTDVILIYRLKHAIERLNKIIFFVSFVLVSFKFLVFEQEYMNEKTSLGNFKHGQNWH